MAYFRHSSEPKPEHKPVFQNYQDEDKEWNGLLEEEETINFDGADPDTNVYYADDSLENRETARLISHTFDFVLSLAGVLICFLLVTVLIYLINWVGMDLTQSFTLLGAGL